jgi:hypothetical protein
MAIKQIKVHAKGTSSLLQHNVQLVDPLCKNKAVRELVLATKKRSKTEDDHKSIARLEFEAGLYWDKDVGPYIPSTWILKSLRDAAALSKQGKGIERGVFCTADKIKILYKGPRDIQGMWDEGMYDRRSVVVGQAKLIRTRPMFDGWSAEFTLMFNQELIDRDILVSSLEQAGAFMGIGDGRRLRFGRFEVKVQNV